VSRSVNSIITRHMIESIAMVKAGIEATNSR